MQGDVKAPRKIAWISKAKGFGILGVLATHTAQVFPVPRGGGVLLAGMYCVQLFFVLSAYLAFKSLDSNRYGGGGIFSISPTNWYGLSLSFIRLD